MTATFRKSVSEIRHFSESVGNWRFNLLNSVCQEVTLFNFRNIICAKVPVWSPAGFSPLFWSCDFEPGRLFIDVHGGLFVEQVLLNLRLGFLKHPDLLRRLPQRVFQSLLDTLDGGGLELEVLGNVVITKVHSLSRYLHTLIHFNSRSYEKYSRQTKWLCSNLLDQILQMAICHWQTQLLPVSVVYEPYTFPQCPIFMLTA